MRLRVDESPTRLKLTAEPAVLKLLKAEFSYQPPDYWRSPSYQLYRHTLDDPRGPQGWDGYLSLVEMQKGDTRRAIMFRGHKEELLRVCEDMAIEVTGTWLSSPFSGLTVDDVPATIVKAKFQLDHAQRECVVSLLNAGVGVVRMTVSSGKTVMFAALAAMIKERMPGARVLYITPTERLVKQVFEEMNKFLPKWDISQAGGGKKDLTGKDMVVATMAQLANKKNLTRLHAGGFFKTFTVLFVDEVHHAPAATWSTVIRLIPALFRYGASDTVKDERKEDICAFYAIRGLFGPVRATIDVTPLIHTGRVAKPHLHLIDIPEWDGRYDHLPHRAELDTPAWCLIDGVWCKGFYRGGAVDETVTDEFGQPVELRGLHTLDLKDRGEVDVESRWCLLERAYDIGIIRNKERNKLVVEWVQHFAGKGWPTLVVATRSLHVLILEQMITSAGLEVETLTGDDTTKERDRVFKWLMQKPGRVLVSPLVKEGVSLPELRGGVIADVVASPDLARQLIGRFIRKKPTGDNEAHIAWFIDRQYASARKNCLKLFEELEKIKGYTYRWPCAGPVVPAPVFEQASFE